MSSSHGKKTHCNYCGLFSLLSQISKQRSGDDNQLLTSFTQQFSGTSYDQILYMAAYRVGHKIHAILSACTWIHITVVITK